MHPANRERFISTGTRSWSRHPNCLGEVLLWFSFALIAVPALSGWSLATWMSPVFVYVLLARIGGILLLESRSDARWRDDPARQAYPARTSVLSPRPPEAGGLRMKR